MDSLSYSDSMLGSLIGFFNGGRIGVDEWLRVPSVQDVYAIGDCSGFLENTGKEVLPALAQVIPLIIGNRPYFPSHRGKHSVPVVLYHSKEIELRDIHDELYCTFI
jgi:pyruvate/2-oxoglutarate dehydrogenase complex dihydrolipoamide dehydrogenase (E3) component